MSKNGGIIGVSDHGGWAVLVTVTSDGTVLDLRWVALVGGRQPKIPHHSEGQALPLDDAVELVECVHLSAEMHGYKRGTSLRRTLRSKGCGYQFTRSAAV